MTQANYTSNLPKEKSSMENIKKLIPIEEEFSIVSSAIKTKNSNKNTTKNQNAQLHENRNYGRTKTLLENYRDIVWTIKFFSDNKNTDENSPYLLKIIHKYPESKTLINALKQTINQLYHKPDDGVDMYDIIKKAYIDEKKSTGEEICDILFISDSYYYRKKRLAIKLISEKLWKSSNPDVEAWKNFIQALNCKRYRKEDS